MKLNQLIKSIPLLNNPTSTNIEIAGVSYHSQEVTEGHLFVCIRGYKTDGHNYLADAAKRGAKVAIVEEIQEDVAIPQFLVENSRVALARLGAAYYDQPSTKMKMIGITATNGKTTTSYMANAILEKEALKTGLIGTVSIKNGDTSIPSELTTPESLDLQYFLNEMVHNDVSHVSMEVSSAALEMYRVEAVDYDIVALNNISQEHVDTHGSFEKYFEVKSSLIRNASENSHAVLNLDDTYSASLVDQTQAQVISFGINNEKGTIRCKDLDLSSGRAKFTFEILKPFKVDDIEYQPTQFDVELGVPGLHSVYNSMTAIIIGLLNGVSIQTIQDAMKEFNGVPRRFEFIYEDKFKVVDDHFANPGNINVTLQTLNFMNYNKLHVVYAIRGQRGAAINRENAEVLAGWAAELGLSEIIATKSIAHTTGKDKVTEAELDAFMDVMAEANIEVHLYDELPDAVEDSLHRAIDDDLILLAGCQGMDYGAGVVLDKIHQADVKVK
ncbi:UDP-N-acetylmuramoyl-L-alanyl-D-glutamate--2,6-diaminopimelate ligase [Virgibacillus natechei]|uniref:UDP-N-acetylmuramoyl-L-alanyl-D-glutamate--2, 6-diaminopimelate ligase n=1 Tax=Virgibacillus natechei TaxID=1216297 RepID=A0ABS4IJB6_9BACI|nr:UDP-N-acetylmuramyl-tripeptide synthetase [Virgibacillus natechei]MBP1971011.1 UDP-N-acetylmuramoyl-L-alanyl-D-glutamate--2,6-diaminopimelate ligase [Virgibacillus natechei]UZD12770.1 UDP-N-acetylmuramyl-tripeptide synthetase [Virgibacillus natechei]